MVAPESLALTAAITFAASAPVTAVSDDPPRPFSAVLLVEGGVAAEVAALAIAAPPRAIPQAAAPIATMVPNFFIDTFLFLLLRAGRSGPLLMIRASVADLRKCWK